MHYLNKRAIAVQTVIDVIDSQVLYQLSMDKSIPELEDYFRDLRENFKIRKEEIILLKGCRK